MAGKVMAIFAIVIFLAAIVGVPIGALFVIACLGVIVWGLFRIAEIWYEIQEGP